MLTFPSVQVLQRDFDPVVYTNQPSTLNLEKRLFDLLVAGLVTVSVLLWLVPIVGLLIKCTSPGPILFVQWRTGLDGQPFRCFKFRTMVHNQQRTPFEQTVFRDSRVTRLGAWLRRTNLDEMPQFLNVLMGNMSVVGPRPHAIQHDSEFWFSLPGYDKRYTVLPGITGLAQVRGARGITDDVRKMEQRLRYDLFYIRKNSFWGDLQICWWTLESMFKGNSKAW